MIDRAIAIAVCGGGPRGGGGPCGPPAEGGGRNWGWHLPELIDESIKEPIIIIMENVKKMKL